MPVPRIRHKVSVTPDPGLVEWLDAKVGVTKRFKDRTHAFEWCVAFLREREKDFGSLEEFEIFCREMSKQWQKLHRGEGRYPVKESGEPEKPRRRIEPRP